MEDMERMKKSTVLLTGNAGYIGTVLTEFLNKNSYQVIGLDSNWFGEKTFFIPSPESQPKVQIIKDMRNVNEKDLEGVDSVIHLAGLSNDPLGEINPKLTEEINYNASIKLALLCKKRGIKRFLFASSCSIYGIASLGMSIDETGGLNPITAYAKAKADVEAKLKELADADFHPVLMRNATVYGLSPKLRLDLVVNNLAAWGYLTGEISIMSDGTPWRPLMHIEDICRAFITVLEAPLEKIHCQVFNVGINSENYRIKDVAGRIHHVLPTSKVKILNSVGPDERTYKVNFSKFENTFPDFKPQWNLEKGIRQLINGYKEYALTMDDFKSDKYSRVRTINSLFESKKMDENLMLTGGKS